MLIKQVQRELLLLLVFLCDISLCVSLFLCVFVKVVKRKKKRAKVRE